MSLQSQIELARRRANASRMEAQHYQEEQVRAHEERMAVFNRYARPNLRRAEARDYNAWVRGYLERGGTIGHAYDYGLPSSYYIAIRDIEILPPLVGAESVSIIVPEGITVSYNGLGHNALFFMDGFECDMTFSPSVYSDTTVE
jgi:hypothetical protein